MHKIFISLALFIGLSSLSAQSYFQQDVKYKIEVRLNDEHHQLHGHLELHYKNNSPDTLSKMFFHVWPRAYQPRTALNNQFLDIGKTDLHLAPDSSLGDMDSLNFYVNRQKVNWQFNPKHRDIAELVLNEPLLPGEEILISTPFRVKIPSYEFSRLGRKGQQYLISQWYPKPAVYDQDGWHPMPYLNMGEFYSEFGSFDVFISLPENYQVAASGNLLTEAEQKRLQALSEATKNRSSFPDDMQFPPSSEKLKTLHYRLDSAHDFAWFADKRFHVKLGQFTLPSGRSVQSEIFFTNKKANIWKDALTFVERATQHYSDWVGEYPYDVVSAVDGGLSAGGGMEYPTVTVISSPSNSKALDIVITHEIGHNWFYGILGSNERQHAWMDEGLNTAFEHRYTEKYYPSPGLFEQAKEKDGGNLFGLGDLQGFDQSYLAFLYAQRLGIDQPLSDAAPCFSYLNYGGLVYGKAGMLLETLRQYWGDEKYDRCFNHYFQQWKFRHPQPDDFFRSMQQCSGDSLHWLKEAVQTANTIDYKITAVKKDEDSIAISLRNVGQINAPIVLAGFDQDKEIWRQPINGFAARYTFNTANLATSRIVIDPDGVVPEFKRGNNHSRVQGRFKQIEPLDFQFIAGLEDSKKTQLFYAPYAAWNNYNKFMLGISLYNSVLIQRPFEFNFKPMYAFGSQSLTGHANVGYNQRFSSGPFSLLQVGLYYKSYDFAPGRTYQRWSPTLKFHFRKNDLSAPFEHSLRLRAVSLQRQADGFELSGFDNFIDQRDYTVYEASYELNNQHVFNPYNLRASLELSEQFGKLSLEFDVEQRLWRKEKMGLRVFAGRFLYNVNSDRGSSYYDFGLSGTPDYLFDYYFLGRSDQTGFTSQQMYLTDGGFKAMSEVFSGRDIYAMNLDLPLLFNFGLYFDGAFVRSAVNTDYELFYGTGARFFLIRDFAEIYFPFYMNNYQIPAYNYLQNVRFRINLDFEDIFENVVGRYK